MESDQVVNKLSDDEDDDDSSWQEEVQCFRMLLVERIQYPYIAAALQSFHVLDREDDEELNNHYHLRTTRMRTNRLIDILLHKGEKNYQKFLEVLGIFYPDVYTEITGKKAPDPKNLHIPRGPDNQELIQLLMQSLEGMKQKAFDNQEQLNKASRIADERSHTIDKLKQENNDLTLRVGRYETIDNEMASLRSEVDRLKNENYTICMRMIDASEENRQLRVSTMTLKNENDKLILDLQKVKRSMDLETSKSVRLRRKLDTGPSEKDILGMRREIEELKLKLAKANNKEINDEDTDMRIQILNKDKEEALDMYGEAVENLHKLRESLAAAESLRDKYFDEKEQNALTCSVLQNDCEMYKKRRDTMWLQLQEVEKEREMLIKERNEAQLNTKVCMEEKARYRTQIREQEKKYDDLAHKLLDCQRELIKTQRTRAPTSEGLQNELGNFSVSYPSSTSSRNESITATSEPASEPGQFRQRAYITKYYTKYVSTPKPTIDEHDDGVSVVFPEIDLASDYAGAQDRSRRRRRLAQNRPWPVPESSVGGETLSNATSRGDDSP